jgi:hypothetical protein
MTDHATALLPVREVAEQDYILVTALANVRAAQHLAVALLPGVDGVFSSDEVREVLIRLARIQAKLTFKMGTTDERDLELAFGPKPKAGG